MKLLWVVLVLAVPFLQDVEAKKARVGEILKKIAEAKKEAGSDKDKIAAAQRKLLPEMEELRRLIPEIAGPDREKQSALFQELMEKYVPEESAAERVASNERNASVALMEIGTAQAQFRAQDPDGDGVANFWVADISGLHRIRGKDGKAANLIEDKTARADARPALAVNEDGKPANADSVQFLRAGASEPRAGYLFVAIVDYETADGKSMPYAGKGGRHETKYGVCAYPSEYGKTGKMTFIKNEAPRPFMWRKDTGGRPPTVYPADPRKEGWQPYE